MDAADRLTDLETELAATRIRIAELVREILRENRAERIAAANTRRQQLEPVAAEVKRLEEALAAEAARTPPKESGPAGSEPVVGGGLAAAQAPLPQPAPQAQAAVTAVNIQETWPTGSDLGQPKTFGLRPPIADLEPEGVSVEEYLRRLTQHLAFAAKVLHTSGVVAVVWREWRAFERLLTQKFRTLNHATPASLPNGAAPP